MRVCIVIINFVSHRYYKHFYYSNRLQFKHCNTCVYEMFVYFIYFEALFKKFVCLYVHLFS